MKLFWMIAAAFVVMPVSAQAMTVEAFLVKARALKAKGPLAIFSSDLAPVRAEIKSVATSYRADLRADRAAGRPPHSCPPPEGSAAAKIKPDAFLADLEAIPPAQRSMNMKTAFYQIMKRRWPCPT
ncbi:hypothetical protein [Sphingomonas sp. LT1P40]|uniref:hypothetical protein n=1 Tax=Alteristakelama amylovorans TaxID=3096166 RepID=UPI002FC6E797